MPENQCGLHTAVPGEDLERLKSSLGPEHVIHTLLCEHERILGFLGEIERAGGEILRWTRIPDDKTLLERLRADVSHLVAAEPHHQREEEVLFPELERRGIYGPPAVMRAEHKELRAMKAQLLELASSASERNFRDFQSKLDPTSRWLVSLLRDHISKENNVLFPMALQVISAKEDWARMKLECDKIGYCCFTP